ncbi:MAG: LicD family protein [Clostridiales bacterium]|nr:LicD family protein [Clostridiales bacterium]
MNAIILAAGIGSRINHLSNETPKPLIEIDGMSLIEKQIIYLKEKNINEINIVVGFKKEMFCFLKEKYNVNLIINEYYDKYNNLYSLFLASEYINDSYFIEGDIYLHNNIFINDLKKDTYFTTFRQNFTKEWVINQEDGQVSSIDIRKGSGNVIAGISFWEKNTCDIIKETLHQMVKQKDFKQKLWGEVILANMNQLKIDVIKLGYNEIYEIDTIKDYYSLKYMIEIEDLRDLYEEQLKKTQVIELRALRILDDICNRNNIEYWLGGGTVLGAHRHGGFIPWDDDIDVVMNRLDYEKFLVIAQNELPHDLYIQCYLTDEKYRYNARIRDAYSSCKTEYEMSDKSHKGLYIDIFPFDFYKVKSNQIKLFSRIATTCFSDVRKIRDVKLDSINNFKPIIKTLYILARLPSLIFSDKFMVKLFQLYKKMITTTKHTAVFYKGPECCFDKFRIVKYEHVFPLSKIEFEGYLFFCPNNLDEYLKALYGDYMTLPSKTEISNSGHFLELDLYKPCQHKNSMHWVKRGSYD